MIVQLNSDRISSTITVILPSGVAFLIANTAALANIGCMVIILVVDLARFYLFLRFSMNKCRQIGGLNPIDGWL
jgi:hypothetical protein